MAKKNLTLVVVGVATILLLGVFVTIVGNVGVRRVRQDAGITFNVNEPVVPGAPTAVTWTYDPSEADRPVELRLRDTGGDQVLTSSTLHRGQATVVFPCAVSGTRGGLHMADKITGELIVWQNIAMLPAGQDCL